MGDINPVHQKIDGFVKNAKVVVFMKGVPTAPQCGFSNAVVQIMRMHDVKFGVTTCWRMKKSDKESKSSVIGPPFHRSFSRENLSEAVTSSCKCTRVESWW